MQNLVHYRCEWQLVRHHRPAQMKKNCNRTAKFVPREGALLGRLFALPMEANEERNFICLIMTECGDKDSFLLLYNRKLNCSAAAPSVDDAFQKILASSTLLIHFH